MSGFAFAFDAFFAALAAPAGLAAAAFGAFGAFAVVCIMALTCGDADGKPKVDFAPLQALMSFWLAASAQ